MTYPVIAIDGPAASGKGWLAQQLAEHFGFYWVDSGLMFRAVALALTCNTLAQEPLNEAAASTAAHNLNLKTLRDSRLRQDDLARLASTLAGFPRVREALKQRQRQLAHQPPPPCQGIVMDGRDIGSVIFPHTPYKIFLTASLATRALRRTRELQQRGGTAILADVRRHMQERDHADRTRVVAPLQAAKDAWRLDSTHLDRDAVLRQAIRWLHHRGLTAACA